MNSIVLILNKMVKFYFLLLKYNKLNYIEFLMLVDDINKNGSIKSRRRIQRIYLSCCAVYVQ
ncbi:hypothetical protein XBO1_1230047 [Xenorhabdus bovienii str. oregonense]|uniref:Uncharacterized protein n=1 Tax=Xenorhabdus bovienii str. oregonense TaxID=1398202 RepID=A0A077P368_XENBV|nr:hypothetical protein XBO1_1230047 [Xenorhabdus bovienii str. oregonense]